MLALPPSSKYHRCSELSLLVQAQESLHSSQHSQQCWAYPQGEQVPYQMALPAKTAPGTGNRCSPSPPFPSLRAWLLVTPLPSGDAGSELQVSPVSRRKQAFEWEGAAPSPSTRLVTDGLGHRPTFLSAGLGPLCQKFLLTRRGQQTFDFLSHQVREMQRE